MMYEMELYHYGIKGQKWGVRRFENKSGHLTSAGKKRYSENKPNYRDKSVKKYMDKGMSKENAEQATDRKIKAMKFTGAVAGITLIALGAYAAKKQYNYRADEWIKEGVNLQRITVGDKIRLDRALYTSRNEIDNMKYRGLFGGGKLGAKDVKAATLQTTSKMKVASRKHAEDTFLELMNKDNDFKKSVSDQVKSFGGFASFERADRNTIDQFINNPNSVPKSKARKVIYDVFNTSLADMTDEGRNVSQKFYEALKNKGYDAITDINDSKYSSLNTKTPTIVFNGKEKLKVSDFRKLSPESIAKDYTKAVAQKNVEQLSKIKIESAKKKVLFGIGALNYATLLNAGNSASVIKYRKEHPNTQLTDKEIYSMMYKKK